MPNIYVYKGTDTNFYCVSVDMQRQKRLSPQNTALVCMYDVVYTAAVYKKVAHFNFPIRRLSLRQRVS